MNWEGNEECFEGGTRKVDQLYEYWLFIQLHQLLGGMEGMVRVAGTGEAEDFLAEEKGQIRIRLQCEKNSYSCFEWRGLLRIDLHYERGFSKEAGVSERGSYSRGFRPDYTLSIYPAELTEEKAQKKGQVAHLHLDAKYRVNKIADVFGKEGDDVAEEKRESKATATYKQADLHKMHTYNDALRDSIGSYVLYPGTEEPTEMRRFHEIAPGVGAYAMKPGNAEALEGLQGFFEEVFGHQADRFSQYRYLADTSYQTLESKPGLVEEGAVRYGVARTDAECVLLWFRKENHEYFKQEGFAYCRADVDEGVELNLGLEIGTELIPCGGGRGEKLQGLGWRAKVTGVRFLSLERLREFLATRGEIPKAPKSGAAYLLFEFSEGSPIEVLQLDEVHRKHRRGSRFMPVRVNWGEIWGR